MKICIKCELEKSLDSFYCHPATADGRLTKCKECCKSEAKDRHYKLMKDPSFLDKERARQRDKYKRLNYTQKQKEWNEGKPWVKKNVYKNLHKKFHIPKGMECHHWNYNDDFLEDFFALTTAQHRHIHRFMVFDFDRKIFKTLSGEYLDTKQKHNDFINKLINEK